jgi:hypothetical protein
MSDFFNPTADLVIVRAELEGPNGVRAVNLALDTAADGVLIHSDHLIALGYDPLQSKKRYRIITSSGHDWACEVGVSGLTCLGHTKRPFPVTCYALNVAAGVDGLLGLDFLRGHVLTLDFVTGRITLT